MNRMRSLSVKNSRSIHTVFSLPRVKDQTHDSQDLSTVFGMDFFSTEADDLAIRVDLGPKFHDQLSIYTDHAALDIFFTAAA